jgi:hypothetical protein
MIERGRQRENIHSANGLGASQTPEPRPFRLEPVFIEGFSCLASGKIQIG